MSNLPENIYRHALLSTQGVGVRTFHKLIKYFTSVREAYYGAHRQLKQAGLSDQLCLKIEQQRTELDLSAELDQLTQEQIQLLAYGEPDYPPLLAQIPDPPPLLYLKGQSGLLKQPVLAIVGTRQCSPYGLRITRKIVQTLTGLGIVTVSGLARGIDYCVHTSSLSFGIPTLAVLGCGIRRFQGNGQKRQECFEDIIKHGLIISEFAPDIPGCPQNFPLRNRLISGLAKHLLVIEAPEKSGALITAANALDQNREVIAVPGPIDDLNSCGTNALIQDGAQILAKAENLPQLLGCTIKPSVLISGTDLSPAEKIIITHLQAHPLTFDELTCKTNLATTVLNTTLTKLTLRNLILETSPQFYSLAH